jgi:hypothetical protein
MTNEQLPKNTAALEAIISRAHKGQKGLPPVHLWEPEFCGKLDIEIKRDGTWFYMGTPIGRAPLVRLFSTVLRKDEDDKTYLVTPVEKIEITVEDAPFLAVEMAVENKDGNQALTFRTNVGDLVTINKEHPLRFEIDPENQGLKPYILVRGRLEALLSRSVLYELIELGEEVKINDISTFAIRSNGKTFPIMESSELERLSL